MASIITPSTTYKDNYSDKTYSSKLIAESITDNVATFSGGTVINLIPPTNPQDAVTKGFVDGLANPSPPVNSVQYNNLVFAGSSNLTFNGSTLAVNGTITSDSTIDMTGGIISGLNDPVTNNEIATKNYVDSFSSFITNTYIQSDVGVTYTAAQMINGLILRNLATDNTFGVSLTDTTATAAQLVAQVPNAQIGYTNRFKIINDNPDSNGTTVEGRDRFSLTVNPGAGVTFFPNGAFNIRRSYAFDAIIRFTNVIVPAVTIIITNCGFASLSFYLSAPTARNNVSYSNYNSLAQMGNIIWNTSNVINTANNYSYVDADIRNQLIVRNPTGNSADLFGAGISPRELNSQVMTIQNISPHTITINGQTDIWDLVTSSITLPTGNQVVICFKNNPITVVSPGSYYDIGLYNTTGGTGTGLTVYLSVETTSTIFAAGTGYTTGLYTTTNLTTPGATGLIIYVTTVDLSGEVTSISDITNYVSGGYQNGDILQLNGGDNLGQIQLLNVNEMSPDVESLGDGNYLSTDIINVSGPGPGVGGQITLGSFLTVMRIGQYAI